MVLILEDHLLCNCFRESYYVERLIGKRLNMCFSYKLKRIYDSNPLCFSSEESSSNFPRLLDSTLIIFMHFFLSQSLESTRRMLQLVEEVRNGHISR